MAAELHYFRESPMCRTGARLCSSLRRPGHRSGAGPPYVAPIAPLREVHENLWRQRMGFRCFLEIIQERPIDNLLPRLVDRRGLSKSLIIHFRAERRGSTLFTILIDVFHCVNQSLDVDCLLPAHFWSRRGFKAHSREYALSIAAPSEQPLEPLSRVRGTAFPLAVICHFSSSTLLSNERFSQALDLSNCGSGLATHLDRRPRDTGVERRMPRLSARFSVL